MMTNDDDIEELLKLREQYRDLIHSTKQSFIKSNLRFYKAGWRPRVIKGIVVWQPPELVKEKEKR